MTHFEAFFCQANIWEIEKKKIYAFKDRNLTFLKKRNLWFIDEDAKIQKAKRNKQSNKKKINCEQLQISQSV